MILKYAFANCYPNRQRSPSAAWSLSVPTKGEPRPELARQLFHELMPDPALGRRHLPSVGDFYLLGFSSIVIPTDVQGRDLLVQRPSAWPSPARESVRGPDFDSLRRSKAT